MGIVKQLKASLIEMGLATEEDFAEVSLKAELHPESLEEIEIDIPDDEQEFRAFILALEDECQGCEYCQPEPETEPEKGFGMAPVKAEGEWVPYDEDDCDCCDCNPELPRVKRITIKIDFD